jgi:hypothetical protein
VLLLLLQSFSSVTEKWVQMSTGSGKAPGEILVELQMTIATTNDPASQPARLHGQFGLSLTTIGEDSAISRNGVPKFVVDCVEMIAKHGQCHHCFPHSSHIPL